MLPGPLLSLALWNPLSRAGLREPDLTSANAVEGIGRFTFGGGWPPWTERPWRQCAGRSRPNVGFGQPVAEWDVLRSPKWLGTSNPHLWKQSAYGRRVFRS
jgi:hypothetical protein